MNVFFDMVGCRLNQAEIDLLALKHASFGDVVVQNAKDADCIFVNTCCVTKKAAADSRKMIRKYQRETNVRVIAMGCWPSAMIEDVQEILDERDIISNDEKFLRIDYPNIDFQGLSEKPMLGARHRTRTFVKVQDGCRNQCSFCLTTIARGASRSALKDDVIDYIHKCQTFGTKEIVLTGVQLGSWGADLEPKENLASLLESILLKTDMPRIRMSSIEPWDVDEALIDLFQDPRMCSHLHIPIQSGSDTILRAMRRPSSAAKLQELFAMIHAKAPHIVVTSDFLVGFPGESENDFEETFKIVNQLGIVGGHVFSYSAMPGTVAAQLENPVQNTISKIRNKRMRELLAGRADEHLISKINLVEDVLFESKLRIDEHVYWSGLGKDMSRIIVPCDKDLRNSIHKVKLEAIDPKGRIIGSLIN